LYARIAEERAAPAWRQWLGRLFRPAAPYGIWKPAASLAAAAVVVALVSSGLRVPDAPLIANKDVANKEALYNGTGVRPATVHQGVAADIDLDQVQQAL